MLSQSTQPHFSGRCMLTETTFREAWEIMLQYQDCFSSSNQIWQLTDKCSAFYYIVSTILYTSGTCSSIETLMPDQLLRTQLIKIQNPQSILPTYIQLFVTPFQYKLQDWNLVWIHYYEPSFFTQIKKSRYVLDEAAAYIRTWTGSSPPYHIGHPSRPIVYATMTTFTAEFVPHHSRAYDRQYDMIEHLLSKVLWNR